MPPKKLTLKSMEAKVASPEEVIVGVKVTLAAMEKTQTALLALLEKSMGKTI